MAKRLQAMGTPGYEKGFQHISLMEDRLTQPVRRKKPTIYFVNSMSDLFQEDVPDQFVDKVFDVIDQTPQHVYQILTKRADRMFEYFANRSVPDNAWLGVSVEDKKYGLPRIPYLQAINAKTRFLSIEPLLEDLGRIRLRGIHWVIVGGESGSKARPMNEAWVVKIKNQCINRGVDFFFKQWGAWGKDGIKRNKTANGRTLEGKTWDKIPTTMSI
jgi:protein gp37